jgi:hypothetical protein
MRAVSSVQQIASPYHSQGLTAAVENRRRVTLSWSRYPEVRFESTDTSTVAKLRDLGMMTFSHISDTPLGHV